MDVALREPSQGFVAKQTTKHSKTNEMHKNENK